MKVSIISFTQNGVRLSKKLKETLKDIEICSYTKCSYVVRKIEPDAPVFYEKNIGEWAKEQMEAKNVLLFIGACGIAVRAIAPCLTDKLHDSPVLVMDEQGMFVIPILSGHMGGANEIALDIAKKTGAKAVFTTATDINGKFAVDLFAKKNGLTIKNKDGIAKVSAKCLADERLLVSIESGHLREKGAIPSYMTVTSYPPMQPVDIVITSEEKNFDATLVLQPKEYVIGMGCRKGKEEEKIKALIESTLQELGITLSQVFALTSIDCKRKEEGFLVWSQKANIPFMTYTVKQLLQTEGTFSKSTFVEAKVGIDNVCERAALRACEAGGRLLLKKRTQDGMTIAVAKREWSVVLYEE